MIGRAGFVVGLLFLVGPALFPAYGQDGKPKVELALTKPELAQLQALTALVDSVMAGKEPAPADAKLKLNHHFFKSTVGLFVPYLVEVSSGKFSSFPVAVYVRAVRKPGAAAVPATEKAVDYPFGDIFFLADAKTLRSTGPDTSEFARGLQLPPGEFDVYIAMMETQPRNSRTPPKRVLHTQSLTVPDFSSGLTTSSIILAKAFEDAPTQLTPQQQLEEPFTIGGNRITPTFTPSFAKSGEILFMFFIYNQGAGATGKPEVDVNYLFFRGNETKPFSKAATSSLNSTTLPAEFTASAGHQLVVSQGFPLASFAPGEYKLQISIADKTNNQTITREIPFAVTP